MDDYQACESCRRRAPADAVFCGACGRSLRERDGSPGAPTGETSAHPWIFVFVVLVLAGASYLAFRPSFDEQLQELQTDHAIASLRVLSWERQIEELGNGWDRTDLRDSLRAAENRLLLVERDLNRLLR